jgi:hypothetical protein
MVTPVASPNLLISCRIAQRRERQPHDAQAGSLHTASDNLAARRGLEPGQPQPPGAGQVTAIAVHDDAYRGGPGR